MIKILLLFEQINFLLEKDGSYFGFSAVEEHGIIRFIFENHYLICTINNDSKPTELFKLLYGDISLGTFVIILIEYKIIKDVEIEKIIESVMKKYDK